MYKSPIYNGLIDGCHRAVARGEERLPTRAHEKGGDGNAIASHAGSEDWACDRAEVSKGVRRRDGRELRRSLGLKHPYTHTKNNLKDHHVY